MNLVLVMAGGAVGAALRYLLGNALAVRLGASWPWGTMTANLAGGFAIGLLAGWLLRIEAAEPVRLLLGVGLLGGFTTFSAFGLDAWTMAERGDWSGFASYVLISVAGAIAATGLGLWIARP